MNWNAYFINMLCVISGKSKDRATKVGAVIVGKHHNILSTGYNGFPRGVYESLSDINGTSHRHVKKNMIKEINKRHSRPDKYMWTEHAERNAIYNAARHGVALDESRIFVDWIPCARCTRAIIQSGIIEVIIDARDQEEKERYWNERWYDDMVISQKMMMEAKVNLLYYKE